MPSGNLKNKSFPYDFFVPVKKIWTSTVGYFFVVEGNTFSKRNFPHKKKTNDKCGHNLKVLRRS